ncbi:MAG: protein kinase [Clostridiales bacterium]|nr:protein kinase [Clostridiales bacterium]
MNSSWRILSCFKHTDDMKVYLAEDDNKAKSIIKIAAGLRARTLKREYETLKTLEGGVFPHPIGFTEIGRNAVLLREYMPGRTLAEYAENRLIGVSTARKFARQACGLAAQMHSKGLIHRDLKPHNFIVAPNGELRLIDMESAQMSLPAHKRMDSMNIATRETAAPEQFGASRSDERTDVYGIGMLMLYLLTCGTDLSDLRRTRGGFGLKRIIRKSTAFDPARRYADVKALEHAIAIAGHAPKIALIALASCMIFTAFVSSGLIGVRSADAALETAAQIGDGAALDSDASGENPSPSTGKTGLKESDAYASNSDMSDFSASSISENESVVFAEPLIEQAASLQLGIPAGSITPADLKSLHKLFICADVPFKEWDDAMYLGGLIYKGEGYNNAGNIESLGDLRLMPNLKELALYAQPLSDISYIAGLPLNRLALGGCGSITDFSALNELEWLEFLNIGGTECWDVSVLENCKHLSAIWMNRIPASDISSLEKLPLEALLCDASSIGDPEALTRFTRLKELNVARPPKGLATILNRMKNLRALYLAGFQEEDLTGLSDLENLTFLSVNLDSAGQGALNSLEGIENFPNLQGLDISGTLVHDISPLSRLLSLEELIMRDVQVESYEPLMDLPALRIVRVSRDVADELHKLGARFAIEPSD